MILVWAIVHVKLWLLSDEQKLNYYDNNDLQFYETI